MLHTHLHPEIRCPLDRRRPPQQSQARSIKRCEVATTPLFSSWALSQFCLISKRRVNQHQIPKTRNETTTGGDTSRHQPPTKQSALAPQKNDPGVYSASEDSH